MASAVEPLRILRCSIVNWVGLEDLFKRREFMDEIIQPDLEMPLRFGEGVKITQWTIAGFIRCMMRQ